MRTRMIVMAGVLAVAGAACANSSGSGGGGRYGAGPSSASVAPSSSSSGGGYGSSGGYGSGGGYGTGSGGGSGSTGTAVLTLTQANYTFSPSTVSVKSGATIEVKNSTTGTPHTFTVPGKGIDVTVSPGSAQKIKIDLPPGTYPFECRFHASMGMKGTLTVR